MLDETDKQLQKYKDVIDKSEFSVHKWLTLASIVELEASAYPQEMPKVAQVFYNRLS